MTGVRAWRKLRKVPLWFYQAHPRIKYGAGYERK